jgi:hypothetical protein
MYRQMMNRTKPYYSMTYMVIIGPRPVYMIYMVIIGPRTVCMTYMVIIGPRPVYMIYEVYISVPKKD